MIGFAELQLFIILQREDVAVEALCFEIAQEFNQRIRIAEDMKELLRSRFETSEKASLQLEDLPVFKVSYQQ